MSKLIKILPCGGWEQTLKLHAEFEDSAIAGKSCKIVSILDGDIKSEYDGKYVDGQEYKKHRFTRLTTSFLPIKSIEKYIKEKLITKPDATFFKMFGDTFYSYKSLSEIIKEYESELSKKKGKERDDKDGKSLWEKLKYYALAQGLTEERFEDKVCEFVYKRDNFGSLGNFVEKQLTGARV